MKKVEDDQQTQEQSFEQLRIKHARRRIEEDQKRTPIAVTCRNLMFAGSVVNGVSAVTVMN